MRLLALGIDHHRADIAFRERLAVTPEAFPRALAAIRERFAEGALLSTCNRTELYVLVGHERTGRRAAAEYLAELSGLDAVVLREALFESWQRDAVEHLFRVACGLESLIVGEHQILGQVREAGEAARSAGAAGPLISRLFSDAVAVGKRARTHSAIARSAVSISAAAVELARQTLGSLEGRRTLVVGAGRMGSLAARGLADRGVARIAVASRTRARARALAARVDGTAIEFGDLSRAIAESDVVISATASDGFVLSESQVRSALAARPARPVVLIDIAVPRDIEPSVGDLPGCTLYNVDDLLAVRDASLAARQAEVGKVEAMLEPAVKRFMSWWDARDVAPTIADLVSRAETIRVAERDRALARLPHLSDRERSAINAMSVAIVNKLLHDPIVRLKDRGRQHDARIYVHAVRELFGLGSVSKDGSEAGRDRQARAAEGSARNEDVA